MLQHKILLQGASNEIAAHLRDVVLKQGEPATSGQVLAAVELDAVPSTIIPIWLSVAQTIQSTQDALQQPFSVLGRAAAIKRIKKFLKTSGWKEVWTALGDTEGILELCADLSVDDVQLLMLAVGSSWPYQDSDKVDRVTELFECLHTPRGSTSPFENPDKRPLRRFYLALLPACSRACVATALARGDVRAETFAKPAIYTAHPDVLREISLQQIQADGVSPDLKLMNALAREQPPTSGEEHGFSASMAFAYTLLKSTANKQNSRKLDIFPIPTIIQTLLKRAIDKGIPQTRIHDIVRLAIEYYHRNPDQRPKMNDDKGFVSLVAQFWGAWRYDKEPMAEDRESWKLLTEVLQLAPRAKSNTNGLNYESLLKVVARSRRYKLLHAAAFVQSKIDLDSVESLKTWKISFFSCGQVCMLQNDDATALVERILQARPTADVITRHRARPVIYRANLSTTYADCKLLLNYLRKGDNGAVHEAAKAIEDCKKTAVTSRDQPMRAFQAKRAIFWATSSRSPALFKEVIEWSKRFVKDPLTVSDIFDTDVISNADVVSLVSGLPSLKSELSTPFEMGQAAEAVKNGNDILIAMFNIALSALREPSFSKNDWVDVLKLFRLVVRKRIDQATWLQETIPTLPDKSFFETLWSPTIEMLVKVETQALLAGHKELGFHRPDGPLAYGLPEAVVLKRRCKSAMRFIDRYAEARDKLWREHRKALQPLATIPTPFPQGLPIQCHMASIDLCAGWDEESAPYLLSRAVEIAFMDPELALSALPPDNEKKAIGSFIDELKTAVNIFILRDDSKRSQQSRSLEVWSHWLPIYRSRANFSASDAASLLQRDLDGGTFVLPADANIHQWDDLPVVPELSGEWDPVVAASKEIDVKASTPCLLDVLLSAKTHATSLQDEFPGVSPPQHTKRSIWDRERFEGRKRIPRGVAEGSILASLLYLDDKKHHGPRLLTSSFPNENSQRYPPVYLDEAFLELKDVDSRQALELLQRFCKRLPPSLLRKLTSNYLQVLSTMESDSSEFGGIEKSAYQLLRLLNKGDRPQLSASLVPATILRNPGSSSWHRQLLTPSFVRKLAAKDARHLLSSFTRGILDLLQEQEARREKTAAQTSDRQPIQQKPLIKVTTVKFLAQFLDGADFVSEDFAVETLANLFEQGKHPDVRLTVVETLKTRLCSCLSTETDDLAEKIFIVLERALPLLSSVEGFHQKEDQDADAEPTSAALEAYSLHLNEWPPLISALFSGSQVPVRRQREFVERLLLPSMKASLASNQKLLRSILRKHGSEKDLANLAVPFTPIATKGVIDKYKTFIPLAVVQNFHCWMMANIQPSAEVERMNEYFRSDADRSASAEGRIWLGLFGRKTPVYKNSFIAWWLTVEWQETQRTDGNGLSVKHVQQMALAQAKAMLDTTSDPDFGDWNAFIRTLEPTSHTQRSSSGANRQAWTSNARPLLEALVQHIDGQRTTEWQQDPHRQPQVLPSTFEMRVWMLPYPALVGGSVQDFANGLRDMLGSTSGSRTVSMFWSNEGLPTMLRAVQKLSTDEAIHFACILTEYITLAGDQTVHDSMFEVLVLQLVIEVFKKCIGQCHNEELLHRSETVMKNWRGSPIEELRMNSLKLSKLIPRHGQGQAANADEVLSGRGEW